MKKTLIFLAATWIPFIPAGAKTLDLSKVSQDANWLMHMDFDAMRKSEVGSFIKSSIEKIPAAVDRINQMKEQYGVDLDGLSYLTMSGSGEQHKGIAIMKGGLDTERLVEFATAQDSIEVSRVGKQKVYSSNKGRHSMAFAPLKKGVVVGGPDSAYVSEGILLAKGKGAPYEGHELLQALAEKIENPGFIFFANVQGAAKRNELDQRAKFMLEKIKAGGMVIGDDGGSIKISAIMETTNEETSSQVEAMIRGGLAMIDLRKATDKKLDTFLNGHSVKRKGNMIWVDIELSIEAILDHLEREMRKAA
jgi:hypothetical protein